MFCGSPNSSAVTTTRAHRAEAVEALALEPLQMAFLQVARRHVVDDRVAEDVLERLARADVLGRDADDDAELHFVVHLLVTDGSHGTASYGPVTVVGVLVKNTGTSGILSSRSRARAASFAWLR